MRRLLSLVLAAAGAACGDAAPNRPTFEVRDSAGIRIVTSQAPAWAAGEGWRVSAEPSVSIGVLAGDAAYQLYDAEDATRLSNGAIVVANSGTEELRFYDAAGRHVRTVGGEGEGPGEFDGMRAVASVAGDTILVWDWSARRLSRFAPEGSFVDATTAQVGTLFPQVVGVFGDGSIVLDDGFRRPAEHGDAGAGPIQDSIAYVRIDPASGAPDTLGTFAGDLQYVQVDERSYALFERPFGDRTAFAAHGTRFYVSDGAFEIRVYEYPASALVAIWRRQRALEPVTAEATNEWLERRLAGVSEDRRAEVRSRYRGVEPAEYLPSYTDLIADDAGYVWARRPDIAAADTMTSEFDVFAPDGHYLGALRLPRRLSPVEIAEEWILAAMQDEFDVGYIVVHTLDRG